MLANSLRIVRTSTGPLLTIVTAGNVTESERRRAGQRGKGFHVKPPRTNFKEPNRLLVLAWWVELVRHVSLALVLVVWRRRSWSWSWSWGERNLPRARAHHRRKRHHFDELNNLQEITHSFLLKIHFKNKGHGGTRWKLSGPLGEKETPFHRTNQFLQETTPSSLTNLGFQKGSWRKLLGLFREKKHTILSKRGDQKSNTGRVTVGSHHALCRISRDEASSSPLISRRFGCNLVDVMCTSPPRSWLIHSDYNPVILLFFIFGSFLVFTHPCWYEWQLCTYTIKFNDVQLTCKLSVSSSLESNAFTSFIFQA